MSALPLSQGSVQRWILAGVFAATWLAGSGASAERAVLYAQVSGARRSSFLDPDGVAGRRFADDISAGWLADPDSLRPAESVWLDGWATGTDAFDVLVAPTGEPSVDDAGRSVLLGSASSPMRVAIVGATLDDTVKRLQSGQEPWLSVARIPRWEEVVELLDLSRSENIAFRQLSEPSHPLTLFREAFLRDKRAANLSLFFLATEHPSVLALRLALASSYESDVLDLVSQSLAGEASRPVSQIEGASAELRHEADARFFAERVRASAGRVYGRLDRIFLSLRAELPRGAVIVIDARGGAEPFVYVEIVGEKPTDAELRTAWAESRSWFRPSEGS